MIPSQVDDYPPGKLTVAAVLAVALALSVVFLYWPATSFELLTYDDELYITRNILISEGISIPKIRQAFTSVHEFFWLPLLWLSFMIDVEFFGMDPGAMHRTNILLHAANSMLLFLLLWRMTGALRRSLLVAALFAFHPLRVESVAWISERKDVLSSFFFFLSLGAYVEYARTSRFAYYFLVLAGFACGLMSKPMLVSLPVVLLLLDFWPLERVSADHGTTKEHVATPLPLARLFIEKIPMMALSVTFGILTLLTQRPLIHTGPVDQDLLSAAGRYSLAVVEYLKRALWPADLTVTAEPVATHRIVEVAAITAVVLVSYAAWKGRHKAPFFMLGWFWYLVMIAPVSGALRYGTLWQPDRYTYLPLIGISIAVAWAMGECWPRRKILALPAAVLIGVVFTLLILTSRKQLTYWRNDRTLFQHAVEVMPESPFARTQLAVALGREGKFEEAFPHFRKALEVSPDYPAAHFNFGVSLMLTGRTEKAAEHFQKALEVDPGDYQSRTNLAHILLEGGALRKARKHFDLLASQQPGNAENYYYLGKIAEAEGLREAAAGYYLQAIKVEASHEPSKRSLRGLGDAE